MQQRAISTRAIFGIDTLELDFIMASLMMMSRA
jgi:hypothetical protein